MLWLVLTAAAKNEGAFSAIPLTQALLHWQGKLYQQIWAKGITCMSQDWCRCLRKVLDGHVRAASIFLSYNKIVVKASQCKRSEQISGKLVSFRSR